MLLGCKAWPEQAVLVDSDQKSTIARSISAAGTRPTDPTSAFLPRSKAELTVKSASYAVFGGKVGTHAVTPVVVMLPQKKCLAGGSCGFSVGGFFPCTSECSGSSRTARNISIQKSRKRGCAGIDAEGRWTYARTVRHAGQIISL
jgi:hypothetical protein